MKKSILRKLWLWIVASAPTLGYKVAGIFTAWASTHAVMLANGAVCNGIVYLIVGTVTGFAAWLMCKFLGLHNVEELQKFLFEEGIRQDEPNGVFGKNTLEQTYEAINDSTVRVEKARLIKE